MPRDGSESVVNTWLGMRQRCNNPNNPQWKDYGGRGITVRWSSLEAFFADVGERPPGLTIDRIDNDGDYMPGNVRWATRAEQRKNRRNPVFVEIEGEKHRLLDLAQQSGIDRNTINERAKRGLPLDQVLSSEKLRDLSGLAFGGMASGAKIRARTHCKNGHEFTPENTRMETGWRRCRACGRLKMRRRKRNRKV